MDRRRDRVLTESFHQMLSRLKVPPRPIDGVPIPRVLQDDINWPQWLGWSRVRMDVRFLRRRENA